jgi:DNA repair exonuclease SbcCD ATPase subunit
MKPFLPIAGVLLLAAHFSPKDDAEANLKEAFALLHDLTETLKPVKDKKTAEGALPKLKAINTRLAALKKKDEDTQRLFPDEEHELRTKFGAKFDAVMNALDAEVVRTVREFDFNSPLASELDRFKEVNEKMRVMNEAKASAVTVQVMRIDKALRSYKAKTGKSPDTLQNLTEGKDATVRAKDLRDPWGNLYCYDPSGPFNQGKKPDVWTDTPAQERIGNWEREK